MEDESRSSELHYGIGLLLQNNCSEARRQVSSFKFQPVWRGKGELSDKGRNYFGSACRKRTAALQLGKTRERYLIMAEKKLVALTFDDGPSIETTEQVLDVLKENDIVASFS